MRFFIYSLTQGNYSEKIGKDTDNEYFDELKAEQLCWMFRLRSDD